jgi:hypothetical protein
MSHLASRLPYCPIRYHDAGSCQEPGETLESSPRGASQGRECRRHPSTRPWRRPSGHPFPDLSQFGFTSPGLPNSYGKSYPMNGHSEDDAFAEESTT